MSEPKNPLQGLANIYLPVDRKTLIQWARYYDRMVPLVRGINEVLSSFFTPNLTFGDVAQDKLDQPWLGAARILTSNVLQMNHELCIHGEATLSVEVGSEPMSLMLLNPEQVSVVETPEGATHVSVRTSDGLGLRLTHFVRVLTRTTPYDLRGTSRIGGVLQLLLYRDRIIDEKPDLKDELVYLDGQITQHLLGPFWTSDPFESLQIRYHQANLWMLGALERDLVSHWCAHRGLEPRPLRWDNPFDLTNVAQRQMLLRRLHVQAGISAEILGSIFKLDLEEIRGWLLEKK